jgi:hypothetical protein
MRLVLELSRLIEDLVEALGQPPVMAACLLLTALLLARLVVAG